MTKISFNTICIALMVASVNAFVPISSPSSTKMSLNAYVPDGLTAAEYQKIKVEDKKKMGKDLGRLGPRGFKSRSMQAWQEAYERGETGHSFAPFGYREKLQNGELKKEDVPYMVRGGVWDNSDIFGAKRLPWSKTDKDYAKATHNTWAAVLPTGALKADDGESGAAMVMLRMMERAELTDHVSIVTRWYGGKKLGGDRFRRVQDATRAYLDQLATGH